MRTTLTIDDDVLLAARALARRQKQTMGSVLSELARRGLNAARAEREANAVDEFLGFRPFSGDGEPATNELVDAIRQSEGI